MKKVFLGGTCNESQWRNELISQLDIDWFNPVVTDWTLDCQEEEIKQRQKCDFCLYVITPKMTGLYSIAEVVDDSNKRPDKTVLCVLRRDGDDEFTEHQERSLKAIETMVANNDCVVCYNLEQVADYLNQ